MVTKNKYMKILNVGSGRETFGTDFIDINPSRKDIIKCDVNNERLPFDNDIFDVVYSKNLLEHLFNPLHFLFEAKRVLKKGGKLCILTDNASFLLFHIPLRQKNYLQHYSNSPRLNKQDRHYFLFTPLHLRNFITLIGGFKKVQTYYFYATPHKFVELVSIIFKNKLLQPHIVLEAIKK